MGLVPVGSSIRDVEEISWLGDDRLAFRCKTQAYPMPDAQARAFRRFCDTIVFNYYPTILRNPGPASDLQCETPSFEMWQLEQKGGKVELWWSPVADIRVSAGLVASTTEATKIARRLTGNQELRFHQHVWLDAPRSIWRGIQAATQQAVRDITRQHSQARDVDQRAERWHDMDNRIAAALESISWEETLKVPGAPASHCLLLHRLKGARLMGWSPAQEGVGCPRCPEASRAGGQLAHVMWMCPMAQKLWTALRARWDHLSSRHFRWDERTFLSNVFSLRLASMPDRLWDHTELTRLSTPSADDTSATHQAIQAVWMRQVMATFHVIWRWRMDASDPDELWTLAQAIAYQDGCLRAILVNPSWRNSAASCHTAAALGLLRQADSESSSSSTLLELAALNVSEALVHPRAPPLSRPTRRRRRRPGTARSSARDRWCRPRRRCAAAWTGTVRTRRRRRRTRPKRTTQPPSAPRRPVRRMRTWRWPILARNRLHQSP